MSTTDPSREMHPSRETDPNRAIWVLGVLGFLLWAALARHFAFVCDDAYITFRYARNLSEGRGLVFNPGDVPPVEGYSNLLWTLALAAAHALGATGEALGVAANALSIACGAGLFGMALNAARRHGASALATGLTGVFLGTLAPFALWSTSGLETMPFALALFASWSLLERARPRPLAAGLAAVAAALLRADGFLWLGLVLGLVFASALARGDRVARRASLTAAGCATLAVAGQFLWRHGYYGEWMPNTARVKTGFSELRLERGLKYLGALMLTVPAFPLIPLLALAFRPTAAEPRPAERASPVALQAGCMLLAGAAYAVYVGGDFMPMGRFLVPTLAFLALLAARAFTGLERRGPLPAFAAAAVLSGGGLSVGLDVTRVPQAWVQALHFRWNKPVAVTEYGQWHFQRDQARNWALLGRALARHTRPGESIIRGPVGAVGYFTELEVLDLNGLVTREVALRAVEPQRVSPGHDKHVEPTYFFPRRPTYLGADLVPSNAPPGAGVSPAVAQIARRGLAVVERSPLAPGEGFPRGVELRLHRFTWPQ